MGFLVKKGALPERPDIMGHGHRDFPDHPEQPPHRRGKLRNFARQQPDAMDQRAGHADLRFPPPRPRSTKIDRSLPILNCQFGDPTELPRIMGQQHQSPRRRLARDKRVIWSDRRAK